MAIRCNLFSICQTHYAYYSSILVSRVGYMGLVLISLWRFFWHLLEWKQKAPRRGRHQAQHWNHNKYESSRSKMWNVKRDSTHLLNCRDFQEDFLSVNEWALQEKIGGRPAVANLCYSEYRKGQYSSRIKCQDFRANLWRYSCGTGHCRATFH